MILPAVPRYPPIVSLYLSDLLPTEKVEYLAYDLFPENFCRSTLSSCFVPDVRRCNALFPKILNAFFRSIRIILSAFWFSDLNEGENVFIVYGI